MSSAAKSNVQFVDRGHERARLIVPDGEVGDLEPAPTGLPMGSEEA